LIAVLVAGALWRGEWLPRAAVLISAASLLAFNLIDPDATIARSNIALVERTGRVDLDYLTGLSYDAVPVIAAADVPWRACVLQAFADRSTEDAPWFAYNHSTSVAERSIGRAKGVCSS
jgi:hypothetical protein